MSTDGDSDVPIPEQANLQRSGSTRGSEHDPLNTKIGVIVEATESDDEANGEVTEKLLEENLVLQEEDSDPDSDLVFINCSGTVVFSHF